MTSRTKIAIIELGYVGLPLAHTFSEKYDVVEFDIAQWRIDELNAGVDHTLELSEVQVREDLQGGMKEVIGWYIENISSKEIKW